MGTFRRSHNGPAWQRLTAGQVMAMNQYSEVGPSGYIPARTPTPTICLTMSIATGSGPSKSATPLQDQFWHVHLKIGAC